MGQVCTINHAAHYGIEPVHFWVDCCVARFIRGYALVITVFFRDGISARLLAYNVSIRMYVVRACVEVDAGFSSCSRDRMFSS